MKTKKKDKKFSEKKKLIKTRIISSLEFVFIAILVDNSSCLGKLIKLLFIIPFKKAKVDEKVQWT